MTRSIFITGANRGLGFSLVNKFLEEGFLVFAGFHSESPQLIDLCKAHPQNVKMVPLDVVDEQSISRAVAFVQSHISGLDVLVNNAAICQEVDVPLEKVDFASIEKMMAVNAFGPLRVTRSFLPMLRRGTMKRIINISSEAGGIGECYRTSWFGYCMSKAALNMESKLLDNYLGPGGFQVVSVHPGWMRTTMGGPKADLSPDESAAGIFSIAADAPKAIDTSFVNHKGEKMNY